MLPARQFCSRQAVPAFLRRVDGTMLGSSSPSSGPRPRFNSPTNPQLPLAGGQALKKPHLASPMLPEGDVPKMPIYSIGKDWVVIYTKDGRPYYYNHETKETTWAHPKTGVVTPPSKPPDETRELSPIIRYAFRAFFGTAGGLMLFVFMGGSPLLGRLAGHSGNGARVVQVSRRE
eukprot:gb/GFBE01068067.1/.p1 GENE.gb/GFBE01068067.1/~~gb/GFBE01068067.1/.p1  ORF type:complete len:175 (+),score=27.83 gb/GFBE01068067.1/:1-525(+)